MKFALGQEIIKFARCWFYWLKKQFFNFGQFFEKQKNKLVIYLMAERGRQGRSFIRWAVLCLVLAGLLIGPFLAKNYPGLIGSDQGRGGLSPSAALKIQTSVEETEFETEISEKPRDGIVEYTVEGGNTLSSIGKKFGISIDTIRWSNNLADINSVRPGQKLKILPVSGVSHKVLKGETLQTIAKKYQTNAQKILDFPFNNVEPETFALMAGDLLYVPDGIMPESIPWQPIGPRYVATAPPGGTPGSGSFSWPAGGTITQERTWYHTGLDIANSQAPNILAADSGTVTLVAQERWGYGWHVIINHNNGFETLYAHLQRIDVSAGQKVNRGTVVGRMGSTGRSTGTHLHFEIRSGGKFLNPRSYLR